MNRVPADLTVRHPFPGETIRPPFGLWDPSCPFVYDRDWIWSAYNEKDVMMAILIASPMHGFVNLVKAFAAPDAPKHGFMKLLRHAIRDCRERGFTGFYMVTDGSGVEGKMVRMVRRHARRFNAIVLPVSAYIVCGAVTKGMV